MFANTMWNVESKKDMIVDSNEQRSSDWAPGHESWWGSMLAWYQTSTDNFPDTISFEVTITLIYQTRFGDLLLL